MMIIIGAVILLVAQQHIEFTQAVSCASNPCNLIPGSYDSVTGYCCTDIPPTFKDSVCSCPNNATPVLNGPCRTGGLPGQAFCNRTCLNGGVCNVVNFTEVCTCLSGNLGSFCEIQGTATRCATANCQVGVCVERTIGNSCYAFCYCSPGWTGVACDQCYFTCTQIGAFPDAAYCALGRYFYCAQASGAPVSATCPAGQKFNRFTGSCDGIYNCT